MHEVEPALEIRPAPQGEQSVLDTEAGVVEKVPAAQSVHAQLMRQLGIPTVRVHPLPKLPARHSEEQTGAVPPPKSFGEMSDILGPMMLMVLPKMEKQPPCRV